MYNDTYDTCNKTYVTLRLYSDRLSPQEITKFLGIEPSATFEKDIEKANHNAWFLTSEGSINSKDSRRHIDFLADKLLPIRERLKILASQSAKIDISCFWSSESGQGGPTLSPQQLSKLAELEIELWFDIY
jgi:ubiquitin C-terminal hydrolase